MHTKTFLSLVASLAAVAFPLTGYGSDHDHHGGHDSDHGHYYGGGGHYYGGGGHYYGGGGHYYGGGGHYYGGGGRYYGGYGYGYGGYGYRPYYWGPSFGLSFYSRPNYVYRGYAVNDNLGAEVQRELRDRGYYGGSIDGSIGPRSRAAIRAFQARHGLYITGTINQPLLRALGIS
jgi:hypothetical protein